MPLSIYLEEFKFAKARLEKNPAVKMVAPAVKSGRKWKAKQAVQQAQVALKHKYAMGCGLRLD